MTDGLHSKFGLSLVLLLSLWTAMPARAGVKSSWKIVHLDAICGVSTAYVSSSYLRRDFPRMKIVTIASSPRWKMLVLNPTSKMFYETTLDDWRKLMFRSTSSLGLSDSARAQHLEYGKGTPVVIKGLKATRYLLLMPDVKGQMKNAPRTRSVEICLADDIVLVPGLAKIWSNFYFIPLTDRLPLRVVHHASTGKTYVVLDTQTVEQKVCAASFLTTPKGYRQGRSVLDVQSGGHLEDMIKEMVESESEK